MGAMLGQLTCVPGFDPGCYGPTLPPEMLAQQLTASDFVNLGDTLRRMHAKIKTIAEAVGRRPAGTQVPLDLAQTLHQAQLQYDDLRGKYTYIYRMIWGTVPAGLGALPVVPITRVVVFLAAMLNLGKLLSILDNLALNWGEDTRRQALTSVPTEQRGSAAEFIYGRNGNGGLDLWGWLQKNLALAGMGAAVLGIALLSRK